MAERQKDPDDLKLEALFRTEPVPDDGFSARVESRVRRALWVRRLSLPIAIVVGTAIAAKPVLQFASVLPDIVAAVSGGLSGIAALPVSGLLQMPLVPLAIVLLAITLLLCHMLED